MLTRLPCPQGYGAIIGTACICALLEIGLSFAPAKVLKRVFPPLVTGPTVVLIGVNLVSIRLSNMPLQEAFVASPPNPLAMIILSKM